MQRFIRDSRRSIFLRNLSTSFQKQSNANSREIVPDTQPGMHITVNTKIPLAKKETRLPFVKEFFIGQVDTEFMAYPEVLKLDELTSLNEVVKPIQNYFGTHGVHLKLDDTVVNQLKQLKMFGFNIPQHLYGRGYFETETQYATESEGLNYEIGSMLSQHRIVADLINEFGTEEQKIKFLPKMATGEWQATIAIFEGGEDDTGEFRTKGTLNVDQKTWKINGFKSHVINANKTQIILIGVQTEYIDYAGEWKEGLTMFLVERQANGVQVGDEVLPNKFNVSLENVIVESDTMLGSFSDGIAVGGKLIERSRLSDGHLSVGIMKNLMKYNGKTNIKKKYGPSILAERPLYKELGGKSSASIYAIESAIYFTTGLLDLYKKPDVNLECAIIKSFASSTALDSVLQNLYYCGQGMLEENTETNKLLNQVINFQTQGESLHSLKLFIGLTGIQYAGRQIHDTVRKVRNPMHNPMTVIGKLFRGQKLDDPKLTMHLSHFLHPSFEQPANLLEKSIIRQQLATEVLLAVLGTEVINHESQVLRLSEICELNFMMLCSLIRASRSYCIGLRFSDYERMLATTFCLEAGQRVQKLAFILGNVDLPTNDYSWAKVGEKYYENGQYFLEHPLARSF